MVTDLDVAAEQIRELCDVLEECDVAIDWLIHTKQLDHKEVQHLLDVRIRIWETTNR